MSNHKDKKLESGFSSAEIVLNAINSGNNSPTRIHQILRDKLFNEGSLKEPDLSEIFEILKKNGMLVY